MTTAPAADTEECLLRAVCDRLDDRLPRLVLADHLDESGRPDEAAAWRATADRRPGMFYDGVWAWYHRDKPVSDFYNFVPRPAFDKLSGVVFAPYWREYPTARAALLDLVQAWVGVEREKERCERCSGDGFEIAPKRAGWQGQRVGLGVYRYQCPACSGSGKAVSAVDTSDTGA